MSVIGYLLFGCPVVHSAFELTVPSHHTSMDGNAKAAELVGEMEPENRIKRTF